MAESIREEVGDDNEKWLGSLSRRRRQGVQDRRARLAQGRSDPPLLELTEFCDKRDIVRKLFRPARGFDRDLKEIEILRNSLAHAGDFAANQGGIQRFVTALRLTETWIDELSR